MGGDGAGAGEDNLAGVVEELSKATKCNHPDIRYCRVPWCEKHVEQTGSDTWAQWYCFMCGESVSEALAKERGVCVEP